MAVAMQPAAQVMRHTELFQDIKVCSLVTEFLTKHKGNMDEGQTLLAMP